MLLLVACISANCRFPQLSKMFEDFSRLDGLHFGVCVCVCLCMCLCVRVCVFEYAGHWCEAMVDLATHAKASHTAPSLRVLVFDVE